MSLVSLIVFYFSAAPMLQLMGRSRGLQPNPLEAAQTGSARFHPSRFVRGSEFSNVMKKRKTALLILVFAVVAGGVYYATTRTERRTRPDRRGDDG